MITKEHFLEFNGKIKAIFKPRESVEELRSDSLDSEFAAYRLDQLYGLNIIPMTVKKTIKIDGKKMKGSLQYYIPDTDALSEFVPGKHLQSVIKRAHELQSDLKNYSNL